MRNTLTLVLVLLIGLAAAQQPTLRFRKIQKENDRGLAGAQCIYRDQEGYMWFGLTSSLLVRYDGERTRAYEPGELASPHFPKANGAVLIFEDRQKQLWIGTRDGALMKYNRAIDRFELANDSLTTTRGYLYSFFEDAEGYFWLGSMGKGLSRYHPKTRDFQLFTSNRSDTTTLWDDYITGLAADAQGQLWISTTGGLCRYNPATNNFTRFTLTNRNPTDTYKYRVLRSLCIARDGKFYMGTYGGLQIFDPVKRQSRHVLAVAHADSLSHNSLFKVIEDPNGALWVATFGGGLNRFYPSENRFEHWRNRPYEDQTLPSDNLFTVYLDSSGLLWVGPGETGVAVHNTRANRFNLVVHRPDDPTSISPGLVNKVYQQNDSIYWLGFFFNGLNRLNLKTGKATRYSHDPKKPGTISYNSIVSLQPDRADVNKLWIGLEGGGVNSLNMKTGVFTNHEPTHASDKLLNKAVSGLLADRDGMIWILQYRDGLTLYDPRTGRFNRIAEDSLSKRFNVSLAGVSDVLEINETVWLNGRQGLTVYDRESNQFKLVSSANAKLQPFRVSSFVEIYPYQQQEVLLLDYAGIHAVGYQNGQFQQKTLLDSAQSSVLSMVMDQQNRLWVSTPRRLTQLDLKTGIKRHFTPADGLFSANFEELFTDRQGRVFVSTQAGIAWFDPGQLVSDTSRMRVVFNDFLVFNRRVELDPMDTLDTYHLTQHIAHTPSVALRHEQNFFSLGYAAQEYVAPEKIQYAYRLIGFDADWVYAGNQSFASYTNLDPGEYTFQVKASNAEGHWSNLITELQVEVLPPFYRTWWFFVLVALFLGIALYYLHRLRLQGALEAERLRNKIASDLHDELGSSLTRISMYADLIRNGQTDGDRDTYVGKIHTLSREIIGAMSDVVWSIDSENDTLEALVSRLRNVGNALFESSKTQLEFNVGTGPSDRTLPPEVRQHLYLIVKEAMTNAARHAYAARVLVTIGLNGSQLQIRVEDDGVGMQRDKLEGNGLRNMKRRAARIGARLDFCAQTGTCLEVIVNLANPHFHGSPATT